MSKASFWVIVFHIVTKFSPFFFAKCEYAVYRKRGFVARKKNGKKCVLPGFTRHHREPKSLGGTNDCANISIVPKLKHEAWTLLFDNFHAQKVAELFMEYWNEFSSDTKILHECKQIAESVLRDLERFNKQVFTEAQLQRMKKVLGDQRLKSKKVNAWRTLFANLSLKEIVDEVNKTWIDPNYKLVIEICQVEKVIIKKL